MGSLSKMNERILQIELEQKITKADCAKLNERIDEIEKLNEKVETEKLNERVQKLECMMQYHR